jgi:hypothetical protein
LITGSDMLLTPAHLFATAKGIALVSLIGVVIEALGGLYLAYDFLGARHGPLRHLSRVLTYSAIFGLGYGITLGSAFGMAGALVSGPTTDYELRRRARQIQPGRPEWIPTSVVRGISFGSAGSIAVDLIYLPEEAFAAAFAQNASVDE